MTNQPDPIRNLTVDGDAVRAAMAPFLADPPEVLLAPWRQERATEEKALAAVPPDQLVPWLVRPLPPAVLAAAGMMDRHRADLTLTATGAEADRWLDQAQAFRGPAGPGRRPGQFAHLS